VTEQHNCPRRSETPGGVFRHNSPDVWRQRGGLAGQENVGRSCSYCGSLHPGRFMELVRDGWIVGPTDKPYKAYLARPRTAQEIAVLRQQWTDATDGAAQIIRAAGQRDGKTAGQVADDLERFWATQELPLASESGHAAKFYYQHLSADQRREFVDLYNARTMRLSYPGFFYSLPYFMVRASQEAS
jgi:hypothetical protein